MNLFLRGVVFIILGVITMSSQSENDQLAVQSNVCKGCVISSQKLGQKIADHFSSIVRVFNFSFEVEGDSRNDFMEITISFTVETASGDIYKNIRCRISEARSLPTKGGLWQVGLEDCGNAQVELIQDYFSLVLNHITIVDTRGDGKKRIGGEFQYPE